VNNGNVEIPAPEITTITNTTIAGTSFCGLCSVDVFTDDEDEGRVYLATAPTDISGVWSISIVGPIPAGTNVTATLTSTMENSSEFSTPQPYDTDGDGWVNGLPTPIDNCPSVPNFSQLNTDAAPIVTAGAPNDNTVANGDTAGDACDDDDDNDGYIDIAELSGCESTLAALNPLKLDTDGDRTMDRAECLMGTNPVDANSRPAAVPAGDTDADGLPSDLETMLGSNPSVADTDADGVVDGVEYRGYNSSPTLGNSDGDSCGDAREINSVDTNTVVNSSDLLLVATRFQQTDQPVHDVNKNGIVNSSDLLHMALNFAVLPC
jgi:hypothetical protein